jgi:hypothetical protein
MSRGFSYLSFEDMLDVLINRTLRLAYELECICKYKNIPLIQFQALDYINKSDKEIWGKKVPENLSQVVKRIVDKSSFKPKFLGGRMWSWDNHLKSLGDDYRMGYDTPANHWVGYTAKLDFDMHPNSEGHTIIKDLIKKELNS